MEKVRKIVVPNFNGEGKHIYEDMLGWQEDTIMEAHSFVSKEIFETFVVECGLNFGFYYVDNDTFYGLHTEGIPIEFFIFERDRTQPYIYWQCEVDTHEGGEVLYSFDELTMDIWDTIKIDGKSLEEVIERSIILVLT